VAAFQQRQVIVHLLGGRVALAEIVVAGFDEDDVGFEKGERARLACSFWRPAENLVRLILFG
jgi:hypothetical protein